MRDWMGQTVAGEIGLDGTEVHKLSARSKSARSHGPAPRPRQHKNRYRIAMVSDFFCPNTGGVETHIYQLARCLLRNGHTVVVLTHAYGSRRGIRYLCAGTLKVYYLPVMVLGNNYLPSVLGSLPFFRRIFIRERIQILHCHSTFSSMAHEALLHAWTLRMGIRSVFTDHSLFGFADASSVLLNKLLLRYSLANADRLICVSHTSKENTVLRAGVPPSRVFVIPNAIDSALFWPDPELFAAEMTTVVVLSRLVYRKGADLLVQVIPEVCRRHSTVQFVIGGDGPKRVDIEEMRERERLLERVQMLGELPHDQVRQVLVRGQIFLNTSLTEAFCMSIVEAASCGLHVVSTRVGGVPEVLPPEFISLAEPNPNSISLTLLSAIHRREQGLLPFRPLDKHSQLSRMYHWGDIARRTEKVYAEALAEPEVELGQRMRNCLSAGFWFGLVWMWGSALNVLLATLLDWLDPIRTDQTEEKKQKGTE